MSSQSKRGFTIIETMLFLAISGVLVVAMIGGVGVSINIQRYRDAVETFKSLLQNQYGALSSVENDRDNDWSCSPLAASEEGGTEVRGQSDCVLVGRLVTVVASDISVYNVLGRPPAVQAPVTDDIAQLRDDYILNVSSVTEDKTTMEWGTQIALPTNGPEKPNTATPMTPRSIAILFVRSPNSGQIYTFTGNTVLSTPTPDMLKSMLISTGAVTSGQPVQGRMYRTICIESNGLFVSADQSIFINAYANGPSSIESQSNAVIRNTTIPRPEHTTQC